MKDMAGVLVALIFWGFVLGVVVLPLWIRYRDRRQLHETVRAYIAKGEAVPPEIASILQRVPADEARSGVNGLGLEVGGLIVTYIAGGVVGFGVIIALVLWGRGDLRDGLTAGPIIAGGGLVAGMLGAGLRAAGRHALAKNGKADRS